MITLARAVDDHARATPSKVALIAADTGARTTYAELAAKSARLAGTLATAHGVGEGDRVAVLAWGHVHTFELLVACCRLGAVLVPLNLRLSDHELGPVLARCEAKVLLVDTSFAERAPEATAPRATFPVDASAEPVTTTGDLALPLVMLFTSGTTGLPKGALQPGKAIAANASSTADAWKLGAGDVALVDAPLFHTGGLNVLATPLLYAGGTVVVAPRFEAEASGDLIVEHRATIAFGVPTMLERFIATGVVDRSSVRLWVTGGAPCPHSLLDAFAEKGRMLVQGFGMTECGPNCFRPFDGMAKGAIGLPTRALEMRLVDDDGADVPEGESGELLLRGPQLFLGYFRDPEATRGAFRDGWLKTGDVLRATPEGWFVAGRKKEMFISGGENVYPAEVEAALMAHAAVAEAAVVSVPDPKWGEAGVAYVLTRATATPEELRVFLRERIAAYKVPRTIHVEGELPRTASNKIDKQALAKRAAQKS